MASQQLSDLIQEAADALRAGRPKRALERLDEAVKLDEDHSEVFHLRGLALAQLKRPTEATDALRRAVALAPHDHRPYYNLAIHLNDLGQVDEGKQMAAEALRISPSNPGIRRLAEDLGLDVPATEEASAVPAQPIDIRPGYEGRHVLPFLTGMERPWLSIGYGLLVACAVLAVLMLVHLPIGPTGKTLKNGMQDINIRPDSVSAFVLFVWLTCGIATFMWMLADIVDRRKRITWLIPIFVCGWLGMQALPLALYLFVGRNLAEGSGSRS